VSLIRGLAISRSYRRLIYGVVTLLATTGLGWMVLSFLLDPEDFSDPLRLWRHRLLIVHGYTAYLLVWFVGSLFPQHQWGGWKARRNRISGFLLSTVILVLGMSGLMLYYPPQDSWREWVSGVHQILGGCLVLMLPLHIWFGRKRRYLNNT
jgi:hypothetical protein